MTKKMLLALGVVVLLFGAGDVYANHCERCRVVANTCIGPTNFGGLVCDYDFNGQCFTTGQCTHAATLEPLASDYSVASVERLDEPASAEDATKVASLEVQVRKE